MIIKSDLVMGSELGSGEFGSVFKGVWRKVLLRSHSADACSPDVLLSRLLSKRCARKPSVVAT